MKPQLRFEQQKMRVSPVGEEASVPDFLGSKIMQNNLEFELDETDEIYEAYGKCSNSYPYRQYVSYNRELMEQDVKTAVLENDFLKAVFLPEFGGRLWELTDKRTGKNLIYTNDVIRFSNLAIRNAWFSGGVEWNVGIIGHTPLTADSLYTARLEDEAGNPVLRMYEYERLRGVEYQMDFWLGEGDRYLNCRMRIVNTSKEIIPMYWWSNMAVPEYENGRIVVPAEEAFTSMDGRVFKVDIPKVKGVDVTRYGEIPAQIDYFFHIPKESPKYIANLNKDGYGLLQFSTQRLQGRKLFSWGHKKGGDHWQKFLTEDAGSYVEIQAGLGKTQYGCIPMPPHSAWEWLEQYGSVSVETKEMSGSFEDLRGHMTDYVSRELADTDLENRLVKSQCMAKSKGTLVLEGSSYGALKNVQRQMDGDRSLSPHLEYHLTDEKKRWIDFLQTGVFFQQHPEDRPDDFMCDEEFYACLKETVKDVNAGNWYAHYQLGAMHMQHCAYKKAREEWKESFRLQENAWACHGLACVYLLEGEKEKAAKWMKRGLSIRISTVSTDLPYVKEGFKILLSADAYEEILRFYELLAEEMQEESRIRYDYLKALGNCGKWDEVRSYLESHPEYMLDDLREGEDSVSELWMETHLRICGESTCEVPAQWDFDSL